MIKQFFANHKALVGAIAAVLTSVSGVVPPPYGQLLMSVAVVLAALSGGVKLPSPAAPPAA